MDSRRMPASDVPSGLLAGMREGKGIFFFGWVEDNATPAIAYLHALRVLTNTTPYWDSKSKMALALKPKMVAPLAFTVRKYSYVRPYDD